MFALDTRYSVWSISTSTAAQNLRRFGTLNLAANQCTTCRVHFSNPDDRYEHFEGCQEFSCRVCGAMLLNYGSLKAHVWRTHHFIIHQCGDCKYISFYDFDDENHKLMSCVLSGRFKCETCEVEFSSFGAVQSHVLRDHIPNPEYKCNFCCYTTDTKPKILVHQERHTMQARLARCPYCAWGSRIIEEVAQHIEDYHVST